MVSSELQAFEIWKWIVNILYDNSEKSILLHGSAYKFQFTSFTAQIHGQLHLALMFLHIYNYKHEVPEQKKKVT